MPGFRGKGIQTAEYRLTPHDHPKTAAERRFIDMTKTAAGVITDIFDNQIQGILLHGAADQRGIQKAVKLFRNHGEYSDIHKMIMTGDVRIVMCFLNRHVLKTVSETVCTAE